MADTLSNIKVLETKKDGINLISKSNWVVDGEKNTKYFLNTFTKLKSKNEKEFTNEKGTINEEENLQKNLYSSKLGDNQGTTTITNNYTHS